MAVQNSNNYFNTIRSHLSRRRGAPEMVFSSKAVKEPDDRQGLQLIPTHSHNENIPDLPFEQPQWPSSPLQCAFVPTSQVSPPQSSSSSLPSEVDRSRDLGKPSLGIIELKLIKSMPKYTYPNGESSVIRRGTFKGVVDRRPAGCPFAKTKSLSHCTFKSCYCMRVPIVSSPLKKCFSIEEPTVNDENDNSDDDDDSMYAVSLDNVSSFSGRIRRMSWSKLKNLIDPVITESRETWATFDDFNANLSNALESSIVSIEPQRVKRSFIHDNFQRMVHRSAPDSASDITSKPHSSPANPSHDRHRHSHRGLTRSLSTGRRGVHKVRSVSSPM